MKPVKALPLAVILMVAACQPSDDPAQGGFFNGVTGIAGGGYQARVDQREAEVADAQSTNTALRAEQAALQAELDRLGGQLTDLKLTILRQSQQAGTLDPATRARVDQTLNARPAGSTDQQKLASLRKAVADARALSADLARLSG